MLTWLSFCLEPDATDRLFSMNTRRWMAYAAAKSAGGGIVSCEDNENMESCQG
jgi:hypothetical protein